MIIKKTWLNVSDNTNVEWLQTFHLYKGFHRKKTKSGFFIKGSAKVVQPPRIEYKGYKFKFNKRGNICRGLIIRQKFPISRLDGTVLYFPSNAIVLIKKKQNTKSKHSIGPSSLALKRKKFKTLFKTLL
jgi:ribosomal protein L14